MYDREYTPDRISDLKEGYNLAVLNMASSMNPGGGVMTGARAQGETLFRRTNLFRSLYQFTEYFINHE